MSVKKIGEGPEYRPSTPDKDSTKDKSHKKVQDVATPKIHSPAASPASSKKSINGTISREKSLSLTSESSEDLSIEQTPKPSHKPKDITPDRLIEYTPAEIEFFLGGAPKEEAIPLFKKALDLVAKEKTGANFLTPFLKSSKIDVKELIDGKSPPMVYFIRQIPTSYFSRAKSLEFVESDSVTKGLDLLKKQGADINQAEQNSDGLSTYTPLMLAAMKGYVTVVKHLLDQGADSKIEAYPLGAREKYSVKTLLEFNQKMGMTSHLTAPAYEEILDLLK